MNQKLGTLYLIPTLLGVTKAEQVIPQGTLEIVRNIRFFVVENVRTARRMLSKMNMPCPIDELTFVGSAAAVHSAYPARNRWWPSAPDAPVPHRVGVHGYPPRAAAGFRPLLLRR